MSRVNRGRWLRRFLFGSVVANVASFPLAALTALVFRFPIPFGGYASGPDAVVPSLYAAGFYGMLGGCLLQGLLGGVAALMVRPSDDGGWIQRGAAAVVVAVPGVLTLSVLDWLIGTW
jgi:hypothetical protein